jgi:SagB-type dehydrogenase family enzyme
MKRNSLAVYTCTLFLLLAFTVVSFGQKLEEVKLPKPQTDGGKPLMQALKARKSTRVFSKKKLSPQVLSNLLWATFGVNRSDGKRTAPSAKNWQEIDIYVALEEGVYLYDAQANTLKPVLAKDVRGTVGRQSFTQDAPVNLIFVADFDRMGRTETAYKNFYSATDTGFISQNVYLFCASEGLATVVLGYVNRAELTKLLDLKSAQKIILAQPVGYPGN